MNCLNILFPRFIAGFLKLLGLQPLYNINLFAFFCIISEFTIQHTIYLFYNIAQTSNLSSLQCLLQKPLIYTVKMFMKMKMKIKMKLFFYVSEPHMCLYMHICYKKLSLRPST